MAYRLTDAQIDEMATLHPWLTEHNWWPKLVEELRASEIFESPPRLVRRAETYGHGDVVIEGWPLHHTRILQTSRFRFYSANWPVVTFQELPEI